MSVKELIKQLSKLPQDAEVIGWNTDTYVNGAYPVSGAYEYDDKVEIVLDYDVLEEEE